MKLHFKFILSISNASSRHAPTYSTLSVNRYTNILTYISLADEVCSTDCAPNGECSGVDVCLCIDTLSAHAYGTTCDNGK